MVRQSVANKGECFKSAMDPSKEGLQTALEPFGFEVLEVLHAE